MKQKIFMWIYRLMLRLGFKQEKTTDIPHIDEFFNEARRITNNGIVSVEINKRTYVSLPNQIDTGYTIHCRHNGEHDCIHDERDYNKALLKLKQIVELQ